MNDNQKEDLKSINDRMSIIMTQMNVINENMKENQLKKDEQHRIFCDLQDKYSRMKDEYYQKEMELRELKNELSNKIIEYSDYANILKEAEI